MPSQIDVVLYPGSDRVSVYLYFTGAILVEAFGHSPPPPFPCTFFSFFSFDLTYSRWTSSLPSCLWSQRIFPSLPGSRLTFFLSRCKFSTLTTRQPMVQVFFSSTRVGIAPPPISLYCTGVIFVEACGHSLPPHFLVLYKCDSRRGARA